MIKKLSTLIKIDGKTAKAEIDRLVGKKMGVLSIQVLKDCNHFCRQDQGALIASSLIYSNLDKGLLIWNTPYAKQVYYTGVAAKDVNKNADILWCEKAKATFGGDWEKLAQKLMGGKVNG